MAFLRIAGVPVFLLLSLLALPSAALPAMSDNRPHWTEKSSFVIGDELYAVGVASRATTIEEGRQKAFDHGVMEIMNFSQSARLSDLVIETQMIFEEASPGRTFTVYRLLKVSVSELLETKERGFQNDWESPRMRETLRRLRALRQAQSPRKFPMFPR